MRDLSPTNARWRSFGFDHVACRGSRKTRARSLLLHGYEDSQSACASLPTAIATLVEDGGAAWVFACIDGYFFRTHPRASNGRRTAVDARRRRVHPGSAGRCAGRAALVAFAAQAECARVAACLRGSAAT